MEKQRRSSAVLLVAALILGLVALRSPAGAGEKDKVSVGVALPPHAAGHTPQKLDLAFCSQLLCVIPFEVARAKGFFAEEGLDVQLVYMKGGPPAVTALQGKSVDFIGTTMDLVVKSTAGGKQIVMVASTARLPFFALVAAPGEAGRITGPEHLVGKKVGVGNLGATDHLLVQLFLRKSGIDPEKVSFVALGPNILQTLVNGQVEAAMVQEPALTLATRKGGRLLVNFMDQHQAQSVLGGPYQFMGLITRPDVIAQNPSLVQRMSNAIVKANRFISREPGPAIASLVPESLLVGGDPALMGEILDQFKGHLYPADGRIQAEDVARVVEAQRASGLLPKTGAPGLSLLFTNEFVERSR
ncbi:MAG: ABC transporter substrate-binding protein [candidate division NC10 bacterium]|nr:ABC transporter substrate-binding protein [candidate division NC10 bacterium]